MIHSFGAEFGIGMIYSKLLQVLDCHSFVDCVTYFLGSVTKTMNRVKDGRGWLVIEQLFETDY